MIRVPSALAFCLLLAVASAQDSVIQALMPLQREIKYILQSQKSLINSLLRPGVDPEKPLSQLYPAVNGVNDTRLRECYNPAVGEDQEFNIFENTIFDIIQAYYKHFPENFDLANLEHKVRNIIKSLYEIGEHVTDCLLYAKSYQLGLTQLTDFSDDEYRVLLGTPRNELVDQSIQSGFASRPARAESFDESDTDTAAAVKEETRLARRKKKGKSAKKRFKRQTVDVDPKCFPKNKSPIPNRFDWRSKGVVTSVKYQGSCGSCWAFASLSVLESALLIKNKTSNKKLDLSEQQLIACAKKEGCNGGTSVDAFNFMLENGGVTDENSLEYDSKQNPLRCRQSERRKKRSARLKDYCLRGVYANVNGKPEHLVDRDIQLAIREFGPVYATINADDVATVKHLKTGIYTNKKCPKVTNHAVVIVGWDKKSWIIKNSWGKKWGDKGFFRMKRGENLCGLNTYITYAIV